MGRRGRRAVCRTEPGGADLLNLHSPHSANLHPQQGGTVVMTVPQDTREAPGAAFAALTTRDLNVLIAKITAGWVTAAAVEPMSPLWRDGGELLKTLNAAWWTAFRRENPGQAGAGP